MILKQRKESQNKNRKQYYPHYCDSFAPFYLLFYRRNESGSWSWIQNGVTEEDKVLPFCQILVSIWKMLRCKNFLHLGGPLSVLVEPLTNSRTCQDRKQLSLFLISHILTVKCPGNPVVKHSLLICVQRSFLLIDVTNVIVKCILLVYGRLVF